MGAFNDDNVSVALAAQLLNDTFEHSLSGSLPKPKFDYISDANLTDIGVTIGSHAGYKLYKAYCKFVGSDSRIDISKAVTCYPEMKSTE